MDLLTGTLRVTLAVAAGEGKQIDIDVLEAKLAAEAVEARHPDFKTEQLPFFRELASTYREMGVEGCTATMAMQVWVTVNRAWIALKKNIVHSLCSPAATA